MATDLTYDELYELAQQEDTGYRLLANGAIHDGKRIVKNPPGGPTTAINQSRSAELHHRRWELARQAWVEGGQLAADKISKSKAPAWTLIGQNIARIAISGSDRAAVEAARYYGQAAGYTQDPKNSSDSGPAVRLELSSGAVEALAGLIMGANGSYKSNYRKHTNETDIVDIDPGVDQAPGGANAGVQGDQPASQQPGSVTAECGDVII